jgi:hypothetical protein
MAMYCAWQRWFAAARLRMAVTDGGGRYQANCASRSAEDRSSLIGATILVQLRERNHV